MMTLTSFGRLWWLVSTIWCTATAYKLAASRFKHGTTEATIMPNNTRTLLLNSALDTSLSETQNSAKLHETSEHQSSVRSHATNSWHSHSSANVQSSLPHLATSPKLTCNTSCHKVTNMVGLLMMVPLEYAPRADEPTPWVMLPLIEPDAQNDEGQSVTQTDIPTPESYTTTTTRSIVVDTGNVSGDQSGQTTGDNPWLRMLNGVSDEHSTDSEQPLGNTVMDRWNRIGQPPTIELANSIQTPSTHPNIDALSSLIFKLLSKLSRHQDIMKSDTVSAQSEVIRPEHTSRKCPPWAISKHSSSSDETMSDLFEEMSQNSKSSSDNIQKLKTHSLDFMQVNQNSGNKIHIRKTREISNRASSKNKTTSIIMKRQRLAPITNRTRFHKSIKHSIEDEVKDKKLKSHQTRSAGLSSSYSSNFSGQWGHGRKVPVNADSPDIEVLNGDDLEGSNEDGDEDAVDDDADNYRQNDDKDDYDDINNNDAKTVDAEIDSDDPERDIEDEPNNEYDDDDDDDDDDERNYEQNENRNGAKNNERNDDDGDAKDEDGDRKYSSRPTNLRASNKFSPSSPLSVTWRRPQRRRPPGILGRNWRIGDPLPQNTILVKYKNHPIKKLELIPPARSFPSATNREYSNSKDYPSDINLGYNYNDPTQEKMPSSNYYDDPQLKSNSANPPHGKQPMVPYHSDSPPISAKPHKTYVGSHSPYSRKTVHPSKFHYPATLHDVPNKLPNYDNQPFSGQPLEQYNFHYPSNGIEAKVELNSVPASISRLSHKAINSNQPANPLSPLETSESNRQIYGDQSLDPSNFQYPPNTRLIKMPFNSDSSSFNIETREPSNLHYPLNTEQSQKQSNGNPSSNQRTMDTYNSQNIPDSRSLLKPTYLDSQPYLENPIDAPHSQNQYETQQALEQSNSGYSNYVGPPSELTYTQNSPDIRQVNKQSNSDHQFFSDQSSRDSPNQHNQYDSGKSLKQSITDNPPYSLPPQDASNMQNPSEIWQTAKQPKSDHVAYPGQSMESSNLQNMHPEAQQVQRQTTFDRVPYSIQSQEAPNLLNSYDSRQAIKQPNSDNSPYVGQSSDSYNPQNIYDDRQRLRQLNPEHLPFVGQALNTYNLAKAFDERQRLKLANTDYLSFNEQKKESYNSQTNNVPNAYDAHSLVKHPNPDQPPYSGQHIDSNKPDYPSAAQMQEQPIFNNNPSNDGQPLQNYNSDQSGNGKLKPSKFHFPPHAKPKEKDFLVYPQSIPNTSQNMTEYYQDSMQRTLYTTKPFHSSLNLMPEENSINAYEQNKFIPQSIRYKQAKPNQAQSMENSIKEGSKEFSSPQLSEFDPGSSDVARIPSSNGAQFNKFNTEKQLQVPQREEMLPNKVEDASMFAQTLQNSKDAQSVAKSGSSPIGPEAKYKFIRNDSGNFKTRQSHEPKLEYEKMKKNVQLQPRDFVEMQDFGDSLRTRWPSVLQQTELNNDPPQIPQNVYLSSTLSNVFGNYEKVAVQSNENSISSPPIASYQTDGYGLLESKYTTTSGNIQKSNIINNVSKLDSNRLPILRKSFTESENNNFSSYQDLAPASPMDFHRQQYQPARHMDNADPSNTSPNSIVSPRYPSGRPTINGNQIPDSLSKSNAPVRSPLASDVISHERNIPPAKVLREFVPGAGSGMMKHQPSYFGRQIKMPFANHVPRSSYYDSFARRDDNTPDYLSSVYYDSFQANPKNASSGGSSANGIQQPSGHYGISGYSENRTNNTADQTLTLTKSDIRLPQNYQSRGHHHTDMEPQPLPYDRKPSFEHQHHLPNTTKPKPLEITPVDRDSFWSSGRDRDSDSRSPPKSIQVTISSLPPLTIPPPTPPPPPLPTTLQPPPQTPKAPHLHGHIQHEVYNEMDTDAAPTFQAKKLPESYSVPSIIKNIQGPQSRNSSINRMTFDDPEYFYNEIRKMSNPDHLGVSPKKNIKKSASVSDIGFDSLPDYKKAWAWSSRNDDVSPLDRF